MYKELYQYLLLNRELSIPGVGTFQLERKPADIDFASKLINPPTYTVALHHGNETVPAKQLNWLADAFDVSYADITARMIAFASDLKEAVFNGKKLEWDGLGTLSKGLAGEIRFEPKLNQSPVGEPIPAAKVIREKAAHTVRVGEDEKTSEEMIEFLNPAEKKRSYEWIAILVIAVLAIAFLVWHFVQNGSATGSQQKISPKQEQPTYRTDGR